MFLIFLPPSLAEEIPGMSEAILKHVRWFPNHVFYKTVLYFTLLQEASRHCDTVSHIWTTIHLSGYSVHHP